MPSMYFYMVSTEPAPDVGPQIRVPLYENNSCNNTLITKRSIPTGISRLLSTASCDRVEEKVCSSSDWKERRKGERKTSIGVAV